ncbi:NAD(P)-dependent dehydrogenase (short-subunit alcohol dehydrogenase family) [Streptacidiphilus sp. BW17]|uniref:SDR family NAD(P)-dependent oxidoreductase n=1 Tax=Streptacidiphilus sp. BW17 TaxID=3156274 RepID=UPI0035165513
MSNAENVDLKGRVVAVAGATGMAGRATVLRLAQAGATVACGDIDARKLDELMDSVRRAVPGAIVVGQVVDLLDPQAAHDWAEHVEAEYGRVDGLIHMVGGWRGAKTFGDVDLADWDFMHDMLVRTLQHTSLGFHEALKRSDNGRFAIISAAAAHKPTGGNAVYATAKAAAETWTLSLADSFKDSSAAAAILVVKALVSPEMRAEKPNAKFAGFTETADLAEQVLSLWARPADEVNGTHLWLTPQ